MGAMAAGLSRDLAAVRHGGRLLVIAADSAGGIGPKTGDALSVPAATVGRFTARVALAEVLAVGAQPLAATAACCVDPATAEQLLCGVRAELAAAGCPDVPLVISTEKNLPTVQTGLGVTVVGSLAAPWPRARRGDGLYAVGSPRVGAAVRLEDPEIADLPLLLRVRPLVHALVPAGSRGLWPEALVLAAEAGLRAEPSGVPAEGSAGPATALVVAAAAPPRATAPIRLLGWLR